ADVTEVLPHPGGDLFGLHAGDADVHRAAEEMLGVGRAVGTRAIAGHHIDAVDVEVGGDGAHDLDRALVHRLFAAGAPATDEVGKLLHDVRLRVTVLVQEGEGRLLVPVRKIERQTGGTIVEPVGHEQVRQVRHVRDQRQGD